MDALASRAGQIVSAAEVKALLTSQYGANPTSVIPSDYAYNRWNSRTKSPLFIWLNRGEYQYVGPEFAFTGLEFTFPSGTTDATISAEWLEGRRTPAQSSISFVPSTVAPTRPEEPSLGQATIDIAPARSVALSRVQLDELYMQYSTMLDLEINMFGCKPTEAIHLLGRLGELYCARHTNGTLARRVNQSGFDVVSGDGRRISVKTSAQKTGFVRINPRTMHQADDLMIVQFVDEQFSILYHGDMRVAASSAKRYEEHLELQLTTAKRMGRDAKVK